VREITESQNGRGWKGPLWVIWSSPPAEAGSVLLGVQTCSDIPGWLQERQGDPSEQHCAGLGGLCWSGDSAFLNR